MSPKAANKARMMTIAAVFISLILALVGGMLGVKPLWESASEANEQAADQESRNDQAQVEVNRLKAQFAKIDDYKALLEELRVQVPTTKQTQEFQRQFSDMADDHNVSVTSIAFSDASLVKVTNKEVADAAVSKPAEADGASSDAESSGSDAASSTDTSSGGSADATTSSESDGGKIAFSNFYVVPVKIDVVGSYSDVLELLRSVQTSEKRILLVSKLSGSTSADTAGKSSGGDLGLTIEGQLSVLVDPNSSQQSPEDENVEKEKLPSTDGKSPMTSSK
ncbi:hypothetical protein [Rarobacter incanus]|uniref:Pilus assembly protein PilO n=1 Tax=Rarobacter incanus TaxID=153494 RepID=A0A542SLU9_9MICO|nr:hypothetical protein [Rarobacter incanus]TQK75606.1 hypothetical protein FB389_0236 [Rarobacter incanus]